MSSCNSSNSTCSPNTVAVFGYGLLSTAIITVTSALGILLFTLLPVAYHDSVTGFLSSMAFGALSSDAILHLIPTALGLHSDDESHGYNEGEHHHQLQHSIILTIVILGLYLFYIIDLLIDNLIHHLHCKSHNRDNSVCRADSFRDSVSTQDIAHCDCELAINDLEKIKSNLGFRHMCRKTLICIKEITAYVWCLLIADCIHNFADGVALGAAFSSTLQLGLSTSIAVLFHELPHELGDYAVMIKSGLSKKQALYLNIVTGLTAFLGFLVGALLSKVQQSAMPWILAFTAGTFLYVALCGIHPTIASGRRNYSWIKQLIFYVGGVTLGITLMIIILVTEGGYN